MRHIVFDLDGTVVDSSRGIGISAARAVETVFPGRRVPDIAPLIGPPIDIVFKRLLGALNDDVTDQLVRAFRTYYDASGWQEFNVYPDAIETLHRLHVAGDRCYLVTNKPRFPTARILEQLDVRGLFTVTISRDSRTPPYADKAGMLGALLNQCGLSSGCGYFVGDTEEDADAASSQDFKFIAAEYGFGGLTGSLHRLSISCLSSLPALLNAHPLSE